IPIFAKFIFVFALLMKNKAMLTDKSLFFFSSMLCSHILCFINTIGIIFKAYFYEIKSFQYHY
ncbi:MAG: hypothetical protein PV354_11215, partial [Bartonella sp.]|nr:hypothetical protein [Bartonella sp.]